MSQIFGIIGTGSIAGHHAKALRDAKGGSVGAVLSRDIERGRAFTAEYGGRAYDSLDAFLKDPEITAVSICGPSGAHMEPAVAAAEAGKHIIVEKPLEITRERCDRIIDAAAHAGVTLSCVFQSRFYDNAIATRQAIDAGRLGRPVMATASIKFFRSQAYYDDGGWKGTKALDGGGALMNQGIHGIDLLLWFMGPVRSVYARTGILGHERIEVEDAAVATVEFASGALGVIEGSTATYPGFLKRIELSGTGGSIILEEENLKTWSFVEEDPGDSDVRARLQATTTSGGGAADPMAIETVGHTRQFEDFIAACKTGRSPLIDGAEARRSVDLILAIYESAAKGAPVDLQ